MNGTTATVKRRIQAGEDVEIDEAEVPYELVQILGAGGHGVVEKVRDATTGLCYARKTFRLDRARLIQARQMLRHEVQTIRALAPHPHIIHVHATYIAGRTLAVILQPVADHGDLAAFLLAFQDMDNENPRKKEARIFIRRAFRCLVNCVAYMHSNAFNHKPVIRHKDIKPRNILMHRGSPILTDFGISNRCADGITTTVGRPDQFTARYCSPEVADHDNRNRTSDIFSLGCVFLEMFEAIHPDTLGTLFSSNFYNPYHEQIESIQAALRKRPVSHLSSIIRGMLHREPTSRFTAEELAHMFEETDAETYCSECANFTLSHQNQSKTFSKRAVRSANPDPSSTNNFQPSRSVPYDKQARQGSAPQANKQRYSQGAFSESPLSYSMPPKTFPSPTVTSPDANSPCTTDIPPLRDFAPSRSIPYRYDEFVRQGPAVYYKCPYQPCTLRDFLSQEEIDAHREHHPLYVCGSCELEGKSWKYSGYESPWESHFPETHRVTTNYGITRCNDSSCSPPGEPRYGKFFLTNYDLSRHVKRQHSI
ncbi:kinase-like domain-containing protein [Clohesyomyces aquaticus]|uniref:non-specific serine/threonine protein kinase n=1 Tax=Clohesyomyces aquaticus TaxID=1231657 RepID=A0A1Y1ZJQ9_9PLEO|nr:kinase-like domain-containing protein [Clohesyomyces aquaticus]